MSAINLLVVILPRISGREDKSLTLATEAMAANQLLIDLLSKIAEQKYASPAQIALAWLLAQQPFIVPIPGTRKLHRLEENMGAADIVLTPDDLRTIDTEVAKITVQGARGIGHERLA
jgi:aryl-alcohol dehydrogenase-like predicted oxidoreductase